MKRFNLIMILMVNIIILQGCIVIPGPIGVVGEYGSAVVQPNPVYVSGGSSYYYTTPRVYSTPRVYNYSPYSVHVPPPAYDYGYGRTNVYYVNPPYHRPPSPPPHHGGGHVPPPPPPPRHH